MCVRIGEIKKKVDGDAVSVTALISEIAESVTKTNKPYVTGVLLDKADKLDFKVWDCTLDEFYKRYKVTETDLTTTPMVARGKVNIYNDVYSVVITAVEKSKEAKIEDFIYSAPYSATKMYEWIVKKIKDSFSSEDLKGIVLYYLEWFKEKIMYYPYSSRHHNEKAGLLYHFYLCLARVYNDTNVLPTVNGNICGVNRDVVATAILFSRSCAFNRYKIDALTGSIKEKDEVSKALFGEYENVEIFQKFKRAYVKELNKGGKMITDELMCDNVTHSLLALYYFRKSATIEAEMVKNIVRNDLNLYEIYEEMCTLATGESKQTLILGDNRRIVNLN